eukprot:g28812.t1
MWQVSQEIGRNLDRGNWPQPRSLDLDLAFYTTSRIQPWLFTDPSRARLTVSSSRSIKSNRNTRELVFSNGLSSVASHPSRGLKIRE